MDAILGNIQSNFNTLISEMNQQHYDSIRFASYRTACKIRFIQKKTNLYLIDLFNAIEIIRENELHNIQDINSEITVNQLYQMAQLLFLQLNKRLPRSQNIDITSSITNLLSFMIYANDVNQSGKINVLFLKIVFCALSSGKFQEKLKYIFSQIVDSTTNNIMMIKFCKFIKSLLQLACTVNESQFYQYDEQVAKTIFHTILLPSLDLKSFIRLFYSATGPPPILSWFVIMHKMAQTEFVIHPTICNSCSQANFTGFRYKCQKCYNYNLCQNCFWEGKSTNSHNSQTHSCKEYLNYKSTSKQLSNSLKRSFKLKSSPKNKIELNDDVNYLNNSYQTNYYELNLSPRNSPFNQVADFDETLSNLTYDNVEDANQQFEKQILPAEQIYMCLNETGVGSPTQYIIIEQQQQQSESLQSNTWPLRQHHQQPTIANFYADLNFELDDEHRLIACYAASLANSNSLNSIVEGYDEFGNPIIHSITVDSHLNDKLNDAYLNEQLAECALAYETKNRELMVEIMRLRNMNDVSPSSDYNSLMNSSINNNLRSLSRFSNSSVHSVKSQQDAVAIEELCYLRERKTELESHLQNLLTSKEELKSQLQNTIKMSENFQNLCSTPPISANSTLNKKEAIEFEKGIGDLEQDALQRDQMFEETENLLKEELYQKSIQSHQDELDEEINKIQKDAKLQEEKELLEDFDRILNVEKTANRLMMNEKQSSQINQFELNSSSNNLNNNNDETTSDESVTLHETSNNKKSNLFNENYESISQFNNNNEKQFKSGLASQVKINHDLNIQNNRNNNNETIELNEEIMHNNILNRNIDLLLSQSNRKSAATNNQQQATKKRINKYELVYGKLDAKENLNQASNTNERFSQQSIPLIKTEQIDRSNRNKANQTSQLVEKRNLEIIRKDIRLLNENSIEEMSEANNSQTNSISSSSYVKFDVRSQPLINFSSIAYVQANRLFNSNVINSNINQNQASSLNKLMNLGSSNTSSDLPAGQFGKMGESLDDSSLDTARIQDNLSSTTDDELRENTDSISDTDDCPTLVDEVNASFD